MRNISAGMLALMFISMFFLLWIIVPKSTHAAPQLASTPKFVPPGGNPPQTFHLTPQYGNPPPDAAGQNPTGPATVIIQLAHPPLTITFQQTLQTTGSVEQAVLAVRNRRLQIDNAQQTLIERLTAPPFNARFVSATAVVSNTVIVVVDASFIPEIQELPGVVAVRRDRIATLDDTNPPPPPGEPSLGPVLD